MRTFRKLPCAARLALAHHQTARAAVKAAREQARHATARAVHLLAEHGLSLQDIGDLLGISRQRVHQIQSALKRD